jgi:hypothetical protein
LSNQVDWNEYPLETKSKARARTWNCLTKAKSQPVQGFFVRIWQNHTIIPRLLMAADK